MQVDAGVQPTNMTDLNDHLFNFIKTQVPDGNENELYNRFCDKMYTDSNYRGFSVNFALGQPVTFEHIRGVNPNGININIICFGKEFYYYMCYIRFLFGINGLNEANTYNITLYCDHITLDYWEQNITQQNYIINSGIQYTPRNNFIELLAETFPNGAEHTRRNMYTNDPFLRENVHIRIVTSNHSLMSTIGYKRGLINIVSKQFQMVYSMTIDDNISGIYNAVLNCPKRRCLERQHCNPPINFALKSQNIGVAQPANNVEKPVLAKKRKEKQADYDLRASQNEAYQAKLAAEYYPYNNLQMSFLLHANTESIISLYIILYGQINDTDCGMIGIMKGAGMGENDINKPNLLSSKIYKLVLFNNTMVRHNYNPFATKFLEDMMFNLDAAYLNCRVNTQYYLRFAHKTPSDNEDCFSVTINEHNYAFNIPVFIIMYLVTDLLKNSVTLGTIPLNPSFNHDGESLVGLTGNSKYLKFHFILFVCLYIQKFLPTMDSIKDFTSLDDSAQFPLLNGILKKYNLEILDPIRDNPENTREVTLKILDIKNYDGTILSLGNNENFFKYIIKFLYYEIEFMKGRGLNPEYNTKLIELKELFEKLKINGTVDRVQTLFETYMPDQESSEEYEKRMAGSKKRGRREKYLKYLNKYLSSINPNHKLLTELDIDMNENVNEKYLEYKQKYLQIKQNNSNGFVSMVNNLLLMFNL